MTETPTVTMALANGHFTEVDAIDEDLLQRRWWLRISRRNAKPYAYREKRTDGKTMKVYLHRVVLARVLDRELSAGEYVDHIDGNGLNNTRGNLRLATKTGNSQNRGKLRNNTTGFKGVYKDHNKWKAIITADGERWYLGMYSTPEQAYEAYKAAALKYHGEFANFG